MLVYVHKWIPSPLIEEFALCLFPEVMKAKQKSRRPTLMALGPALWDATEVSNVPVSLLCKEKKNIMHVGSS